MKKHIQIFKLENEFEKSLSKYQSSYLNTPSNQKNQKNSFFIKNNLFTNSCLKNIVSFEDIDKIKLYRNQSKFHSNRVFKGYNNKYHKNNKQYLRKLPATKKLIAITENKEIIYKHIFQKTMMGKQQENYSRNNSIMYILSHTIAQGRQFTELSYPNKFNNQRKQLQSLETSTF